MPEEISSSSIESLSPRQIVLDALRYVEKGDALDLGSGWGRHALLLASKGFSVTAVDSKEVGLESVNRKALEMGVTVRTEQGDVKDFDSHGEQYDLILSTMVLHFLANHGEMAAAVKKMQEMTRENGVNVICSYSDKSQEDLRPYLLNADELRKLYTEWEILRFEEFQGTDHGVDGPEKGKMIWRVEMIARKS